MQWLALSKWPTTAGSPAPLSTWSWWWVHSQKRYELLSLERWTMLKISTRFHTMWPLFPAGLTCGLACSCHQI
jgi:hypothetical protein